MAGHKRTLAFFLAAAVVFFLLNAGAGFFGELLAPAGLSGLWARAAAALVLAAILTGNIALLSLLPFWPQVVIVWLELLVLALAFFASFNLSYDFILSRIGFLITQGAVTTVYISLVAIVLASIIALIAALARLSPGSTSRSFAARHFCSRSI